MKVALLGFGKAGQALFEELNQNPYIENISVYDPDFTVPKASTLDNLPKIVFFKDEFRFENQVDLVIIATPDHVHLQYLLKCIELGIPSFVEKPFVSSRKQFEAVNLVLSNKPDYLTTCNLILRTSPLFKQLREEFVNGTFGTRVFIEGKYLYGRWKKLVDGWRGHKDYSVVLGGLIHLVDLACYITRNFDYDVSIHSQRLTYKEPSSVVDFAQISMSSPVSGFYSLSTNFSANVEHRRDFAIYGDSAWVDIKGQVIECSNNILSSLGSLSPNPPFKGALLSEFIAKLNGAESDSSSFPKMDEIQKTLSICFGYSSDSLSN